MEQLTLKSNEVNKDALKYDYVEAKIKIQSDLKPLREQILKVNDSKETKIDMSGVKNYFNTIKNKNFDEIKQEGATWSFAVQLFLKSQGLYDGRIDGLYMNAGQSESKTRKAVREFQIQNGLTGDGWAGPETINKMLEKIDVKPANPEVDMNKILENPEITDAYKKLNPISQLQFKNGGYVIETKEYSYKIFDKQLQRTKKTVDPISVVEELLLIDGKWGKKEEKPTTKENNEKNPDFPKVGFDQIKTYPFKAYFVKLFGTKITEEYQKKYNLFQGSKFKYITYREAKNVGGYIDFLYSRSRSEKMPDRTIYANDVKNEEDGTIDIPKFLNAVKSKIDIEEQYRKNILLEKENRMLKKEVNRGIQNIQLKDFSTLIQAYVKAHNRVIYGKVFLPQYTIMISGEYLRVLIPGEKNANHIDLNYLKSSGKFDEKKLLHFLSVVLTPLAKKWKDSLK